MRALLKKIRSVDKDTNKSKDNKNAWNSIEMLFGEAEIDDEGLQQFANAACKNQPLPTNATCKKPPENDTEELITLGLLYKFNHTTDQGEKYKVLEQLTTRDNYNTVVSYDIKCRHARRRRAYQKQLQNI